MEAPEIWLHGVVLDHKRAIEVLIENFGQVGSAWSRVDAEQIPASVFGAYHWQPAKPVSPQLHSNFEGLRCIYCCAWTWCVQQACKLVAFVSREVDQQDMRDTSCIQSD